MARPRRQEPDVFHALGHRKRRQILELVAAAGALSIGAIAANFGDTRQAVSKHVAVLAEANVLQIENNANERQCTVNYEAFVEVQQWLKLFDAHWEDSLASLKEFVENERG